jgi:hypothetical protein
MTTRGPDLHGRLEHLAYVLAPVNVRAHRASRTLSISNLPPRNLAFTGRDELLERLHQQLTAPTAVAAVAVTALADDATSSAVSGNVCPIGE